MRLTDAAALRIKDVMARAEKPVAGVRVGVKNGGCAGMEYTMEYADAVKPTDEVVEDKGVKTPDRSEGGAVPARHRDGLQIREIIGPVRVQQSEPDQRLWLRRVGPAHAGERLRLAFAAFRASAPVSLSAESVSQMTLFRPFRLAA